MCLFPDHGLIQVLEGEKVGPDDPLGSPNCPLQSVPVWFFGLSKPDSHGSAEDLMERAKYHLLKPSYNHSVCIFLRREQPYTHKETVNS